ncbi:MAG: peptidoglycan-associated lipoprotein Pal [Burkholderiales bacterium]
MQKELIAVLALALLYGCASEPAKVEGKAGVEERMPVPTAQTPPVTTRPAMPSAVEVNPLKDPNNILSKRSVFYEYDKSDVKDEYRPMLQAHGKYLADHRTAKMLVQGNCDERGSREYNVALGQRRADGVKRTLMLMGGAEPQIESISLGEEKPRCAEHAESCWAQNRRSDMLYSGEY